MVTMREVGVLALGITGGAVIGEVTKRLGARTGIPVDYLNVGLGGALMLGSDKITKNRDYQEALMIAGGVASIGTIVSKVFSKIMPTPGATLTVAPAVVRKAPVAESTVTVD